MPTSHSVVYVSSRELLNALPANAAVLAPDGEIKAVNTHWADFADQNGLRMPRFGVGSNYLQICESARGPDRNVSLEVAANLRQLSKGLRDRFSFEYPCHSPHEQRWFVLQATRIGSLHPAPVLVMHENVTDSVARQHRLADLNSELASLASFISHDVRAPLHTIESHLELIEHSLPRDPDSATTQHFEAVHATARHLTAFVTEALNLAVLSQDEEMPVERLDMDDVAEQAMQNIAQLAHERHATVEVGKLGFAHGNRTYAVQLVQNLLANAIVHSSNPPHVQVGVVEREKEKLFFVRDTGPGIAPELAPVIFEPFRRGARSGTGTGLGLAICHHIVQRHHGRIFLESTPGAGCTFYFSLAEPQHKGGTVRKRDHASVVPKALAGHRSH